VEIVDRHRARRQFHGYRRQSHEWSSWCAVAVLALLVLAMMLALFG
jgi:hypothetical protein